MTHLFEDRAGSCNLEASAPHVPRNRTAEKPSLLGQLGQILKRQVGVKGRRSLHRKGHVEGAFRRRPPGCLRGDSQHKCFCKQPDNPKVQGHPKFSQRDRGTQLVSSSDVRTSLQENLHGQPERRTWCPLPLRGPIGLVVLLSRLRTPL